MDGLSIARERIAREADAGAFVRRCDADGTTF
jgi:hypothetical protein